MWTPRGARPLIVAALTGAVLVIAPTASAGVKAPAGLVPNDATKVDRLPVFTWNPVKGADHYEFQMAADKGFNSTVANGKVSTKNTAVTLPSSLINATYYWRVRSVTAASATSNWTRTRSIALKWAPVTNVTGPADGQSFITPATTPGDALVLRWAPMAGAAQYSVSIASDPLLVSLVSGGAQTIDGTSFTLNGAVPDGTYYWSVTPLDAGGHKGLPSTTRSVVVHWNASAGSPVVTDLASDPELMDPLFSWGTVLGASQYEVEISTSQDFVAGSKVASATTTATSFSPTSLFQDNTYYWRVRPYDASNNAGPWTLGMPFTKTFDNVPPLVAPSVKNIRMRDMSDIGSTSSMTPVIQWDPVMGASKYELELDKWTGSFCNGADSLRYTVPVPAWTPQGSPNSSPPIGNAGGAAGSGDAMPDGSSWCVQVRAFDTDSSGNSVAGDWSLYNNYNGPLFTFSAADPTGNPALCGTWLCPQYYMSPVNSTESQTPPVFIWKPLANARGYYIVVSKDPNFSNIIDYVFTNKTAYAPRKLYADETVGSQLYWAILPSTQPDGSVYVQAGLLASQGHPQVFSKQSIAPSILPPSVDGAGVSFQWAPLIGAAYYTLQVATDASFSNQLESVDTDSASFTATKSYPAGQTLYYRVRANDASGNGLSWATGVFARTLPAPVPAAAAGDINPPKLDGIPNWAWSAVPGATAYDVHVDYPTGTTQDANGIHGTTTSWSKFDGPGVWHWKVRAEFGGSTVGPWSPVQTFTRTFGEPAGRHAVVTKTRMIISWDPKQGAKTYHLQVSVNKDFSSTVDDVTQDTTRFAPSLSSSGYTDGGTLLWRVAAVDAEGNQGDWSAVAKLVLAKGLKVAGDASPSMGKAQTIKITVTNVKGAAIKGVTVRVAGAGTPPRGKQTNKKGIVLLKVRPNSKGTVTFRATKSGYQLGTLVYTIT